MCRADGDNMCWSTLQRRMGVLGKCMQLQSGSLWPVEGCVMPGGHRGCVGATGDPPGYWDALGVWGRKVRTEALLWSSEGAREAAQSRSFARHLPAARSFVVFSLFEAGEGGGLRAESFLLEQSNADFDNCSALVVHPGLCVRVTEGKSIIEDRALCHASFFSKQLALQAWVPFLYCRRRRRRRRGDLPHEREQLRHLPGLLWCLGGTELQGKGLGKAFRFAFRSHAQAPAAGGFAWERG